MTRVYQNRTQAFGMAEAIAHRVCSDPVLWLAFRLTQGLGPSHQAARLRYFLAYPPNYLHTLTYLKGKICRLPKVGLDCSDSQTGFGAW